jgi:hypothetical protein
MSAIKKFNEIFKYHKWLETSKNVIHFPMRDPNDPKDIKTLPGVTWIEIKELVDLASKK